MRVARASTAQRVDDMLHRATSGEGRQAFTQLLTTSALEAASQADARTDAGKGWPLDGMVLSVKDLFDIEGMPTWAGSRSLQDASAAASDAAAVARLRSAGAVIIGKTNMTEFAFSGLGINPHFGTPRAPFDRATGLIPGGSSSGAAVSVADGLADAALGTDTGGSLRIPAAYCGLCGFKPTQSRVSRQGTIPLSPTLDCVGPIARDVETIAVIDAVLSGERYQLAERPIESLRLGIVENYVWSDVDGAVGEAVELAITAFRRAGAIVECLSIPELEELPRINARGGFAAIEAYAWHRDRLDRYAHDYDPRVLARIMRGAQAGRNDLATLHAERDLLKSSADRRLMSFDALISPTVPITAPSIAELEADDSHFHTTNLLVLRNPSIANFFDWCSLSLPLALKAGSSAGLMLFGRSLGDRALLETGRALEKVLSRLD